MHATRLSTLRSSRALSSAVQTSASAVPAEHSDLPYYLRSIRYRESSADLSRLWDPSLLARLHAPLTRFHE